MAIDISHLNLIVLAVLSNLGLLKIVLVLALVFYTHKSCFSDNLGRNCEEGTSGKFLDLTTMMKHYAFYHMKLMSVHQPFRDSFYPTLVTVM